MDFIAIIKFITDMKLVLWFTGNFWTRLLFLAIFAVASVGLYSISKHSSEDQIGAQFYRVHYFYIDFLNTVYTSVTKAYKAVVILGLVTFGVCLFFNPFVTSWLFVIFSALIVFLAFLRLLLNIREKTNFLRPAWKHTDPWERRKAVDRISSERILRKLALKDRDSSVRESAVKKINDLSVVEKVVLHDKSTTVRKAAAEKISNPEILEKVALNDKDSDVRKIAIEKIAGEDVLKKVALEDGDYVLRTIAANKISRQEILEKIALDAEYSSVREIAIKKITSDEVLKNVFLQEKDSYPRVMALEKINSPEILEEIAKNPDIQLGSAAAFRLAKLGDQRAIEYLILALGARSPLEKATEYYYSSIRTDAARALQELLKKYPELDTAVMGKRIARATYGQYTDHVDHSDCSWECRD